MTDNAFSKNLWINKIYILRFGKVGKMDTYKCIS